ncbi:hypothetical protein EDD18DRAFT_1357011 [Armillaria luteobubalina]|uniref:Uncharacterized protein n=1 Tax=Armillaria luteobubalina TaxID=153913 RepID=A0AA39UKH0_9AGAR|nr:hypothetical protein EDD18DRAFT_1357011 [Armillaria luteobubalina]
MVALEHIEENHGTDAALDVARKLPASRRLFIEMGHLAGDSFKQEIEDAVQSKAAATKDFAQAPVPPLLEESTPSASPSHSGPSDEAVPDNGQEAPLPKAIDLLGLSGLDSLATPPGFLGVPGFQTTRFGETTYG